MHRLSRDYEYTSPEQSGDDDSSLNENVYKGADFPLHAQLYDQLQQISKDLTTGFLDRITIKTISSRSGE
jgi:hypothetical protein